MRIKTRAALILGAALVALAIPAHAGFMPTVVPQPAGSQAPPPAHRLMIAGRYDLRPLFYDRAQTRPYMVNGHQDYALGQTLTLTLADGNSVKAFAGARTDLASVPKVFWNVFPPDGRYSLIAVFHDQCYRTKGTFEWYHHVGRTRAAPYTRAECDDAIFRAGMAALGVPTFERVVMYEAVRLGGGNGWGS